MSSVVQELYIRNVITPPKWLPLNIQYETEMGSQSYGVANDASDLDICGFAIPPLHDLFPHMSGEIAGFGVQHQRFEQYQEHHVVDGESQYDLTIYSITKYFQLCMENKPNMIDSLFTDADSVRHLTAVGRIVRSNRKLFLHKGAYHKFRGYAYSQLNKMHNGRKGKRSQMVEEYGFDLKFAYHLVRLALECEQILSTGDLNLRRDRELLKAIRRGEWTEPRIREWFSQKERHLEQLYERSPLPYGPDEKAIKRVLMNCLEEHYGRIGIKVAQGAPVAATEPSGLLGELQSLVAKYGA